MNCPAEAAVVEKVGGFLQEQILDPAAVCLNSGDASCSHCAGDVLESSSVVLDGGVGLHGGAGGTSKPVQPGKHHYDVFKSSQAFERIKGAFLRQAESVRCSKIVGRRTNGCRNAGCYRGTRLESHRHDKAAALTILERRGNQMGHVSVRVEKKLRPFAPIECNQTAVG
jgi:hypothetical protein